MPELHSFKDTKGREWRLEANLGSYGRVSSSTSVKLWDIATENRESLVQLTDALILGQVLWAMVEQQAEAKGVTPEDFAAAFNGDTLEAAYNALLDEMLFFCPTRQRAMLELAVKKIRGVEAKAAQIAGDRLEEFEKEIDKALDQLILGYSRGSLPESSASTPANGPSGSCSTPSGADDARNGTTLVQSSPN